MRRKKGQDVEENIVENTYKTKIKYKCPKRGWVEEEVEVKRYKAQEPTRDSQVEIEAFDIEAIDDL